MYRHALPRSTRITAITPTDEWKRRRIDRWTEEFPGVSTLTTVYAYQNDGLVRGVTRMQKFGLPDVVVDGFPWSQNRAGNSTINLLTQSWAEGRTLAAAGEFVILKMQEEREKE